MAKKKPYKLPSVNNLKASEPILSYGRIASSGSDLPILSPEEMDIKISRSLEQIAKGEIVSHEEMSAFLRKYQFQ